ncbi:GNAT family N-acetyltransferase [Salinibaculum salinum]|uniref:GNAT family N-acetyltransferase n=1 Tax=Salinibaculum salinum TaxID=3131996 RepID=UPI0030EF96F7
MSPDMLTADTDSEYVVRMFDTGDRSDYLALYDTVLGTASDEWFTWKYGRNPYTDHIPIVVADYDGEIVGAKSMLGMQLKHDETTLSALQPCDTMVHPDHRFQGLFSRMTEFSKNIYAERDVDLFFNFPNSKTLSGALKHGWEHLQDVPVSYRIQNPVSCAGVDGGPLGTVAESLSVRVLSAYYDWVDQSVSAPSSFAIDRRSTVPTAKLGTLYERTVPNRIHTVRDKRYYDWRFDTPKWSYETYLATHDEAVVAAVVVGTRPGEPTSIAQLTDVLPLGGCERSTGVLEALLQRLLPEYRDAEMIAVAGDSLPDSVCRTFGFRSDNRQPLAQFTTPTPLVAYPLCPDDSAAGRGLLDASNWLVTFADMDTR